MWLIRKDIKIEKGIRMLENPYQRLKKIISELDYIFKKGKLALVKANGYDYVVSGYHVSRNFIMFYFGKDFLDAYHYSDIQEIKELM